MKILGPTLALVLGIVGMAAGKLAGSWTAKEIMRPERSHVGLPPIGAPLAANPNFNSSALRVQPRFRPIDTRTGQRLAVESAARRADLQIRAAQSAMPRNIPGVPRW